MAFRRAKIDVASPVPGTPRSAFPTDVWKGLEIIEGLRGHVSGLGVPVDGLHGTGKIPLMPNYLVSASENAVILRNCDLVEGGGPAVPLRS